MFNWNYFNPYSNLVIFFFIIWEEFWKGVALWRSAKKGELWWFIAILIINSFGILPIFYLWRSKQLNGVLKDTQHFFSSKLKK